MLNYYWYAFFGGYALFLLGFAVFMYFENQKFGDNQFTMKLLPPPPRLAYPSVSDQGVVSESAISAPDWTPVPERSPAHIPSVPVGAKSFSRIR